MLMLELLIIPTGIATDNCSSNGCTSPKTHGSDSLRYKFVTRRRGWLLTGATGGPHQPVSHAYVEDHAGHMPTEVAVQLVVLEHQMAYQKVPMPMVARGGYWELLTHQERTVGQLRATQSPHQHQHNFLTLVWVLTMWASQAQNPSLAAAVQPKRADALLEKAPSRHRCRPIPTHQQLTHQLSCCWGQLENFLQLHQSAYPRLSSVTSSCAFSQHVATSILISGVHLLWCLWSCRGETWFRGVVWSFRGETSYLHVA